MSPASGVRVMPTCFSCLFLVVLLWNSCLHQVTASASDDGQKTSSTDSDATVCLEQECKVLHEWLMIEYLWPNQTMKTDYTNEGLYNPHHCLLSGVKVYKGHLFVTIPRIRYYYGVPSTLNKVVIDPTNNMAVLKPFPDWETQKQGSDCDNLQMAMSIEIDPVTGYLYVIDPGRPGIVGTPENGVEAPYKCPPKLVVFDANTGTRVYTYTFPESVASKETNFLNDIVLDRGDHALPKLVDWVYITDAIDSKLYVVNMATNESRALHHSSMDYELDESVINVNGVNYTLSLPIDGLAMSPDFKYVYYCALGSRKLWRVPTSALRDPKSSIADHVSFVGVKSSQTGGMIYATDNLYYGGLSKNAVYKWAIKKDMEEQGVGEEELVLKSETAIAQDDVKLIWPDAFSIDEKGYMYVTACRANLFLKGAMNFTGGQGANFRIWKIKIGEGGYLSEKSNNGGSATTYGFIGVVTLLLSLPLSRLIHSIGVGGTV